MLPQETRQRLFRTGFRAIAATRADRWLAPVARGRGIILTFHHVRPEAPAAGNFAPNRLLAITPAFLARTLDALDEAGFEVVPLDAVPGRLAGDSRQGGAPREEGGLRPFAVLTFDDGYRDNAQHARPVLARRGLPWTLFVASDYAAGAGRLWWLELEAAVRAAPRLRLDLGDARLDLPAGTAGEKGLAFDTAYRALRALPEPALREGVARLCTQAGVPVGADAARLCLSWEELAALARDPAVTIGAHTLSHPRLATLPEAEARREIVEARAHLERRLGVPVRHLSYPVGDPGSAGAREFRLAREAGFATAVTMRPGHLFPGHAAHPHALPRVSVNGCFQTPAALTALLSGVPFLAWNRGRRLSVA